LNKILIAACLGTACFFIACHNSAKEPAGSETAGKEKEFDMYEVSELAFLMDKMYEDNLRIGEDIRQGHIPETFPEDFYNIHTATVSAGMKINRETFNALAKQYLSNMEAITKAKDVRQAKIAYNEMIMTCASCHQIYCQGPLNKIRNMTIPEE